MKRILVLFLGIFYTAISFSQDINTLLSEYNKGNARFVIDNVENVTVDKAGIDIKLLQGRAYADLGYFAKAIPYLEFVKKSDKAANWQRAWSTAYLGVCLYGLGKYKESRIALITTIESNITKNASQFAAKRMKLYGFTSTYRNFVTVKTKNIIFHFDPLSLKLISDTSEFMRLRIVAYQKISAFLNERLDGQVNFFVWSLKDSMKNELNQEYGFAVPPMRIVHSLYFQTPGHELTHIFSKIDNSDKSSLINEGIAVYLDQSHRTKALSLKNKDVHINSIEGLWNSKFTEEDSFYPIAGAFVEHLIKTGGKDTFLKLFKLQTLRNAKEVYGKNWTAIISSFEKDHLM